MERLNAFTLLKSVDNNGKLFQTFITLHAKETAPSGAGTTGFIQLVHVATCNSVWV